MGCLKGAPIMVYGVKEAICCIKTLYFNLKLFLSWYILYYIIDFERYVHRGTGFYGFPLRLGVSGELSLLTVTV